MDVHDAQGRRPRTIGSHVAAIRRERNWTLQEFSRVTGVSISTLSKLENDQAGLTFATVLKIVDGLGITVDQLLAGNAGTDTGAGAGAGAGAGRRAFNRDGSGLRLATHQYGYEIFATELRNKAMVPLITTVMARSIEEWGGTFSRHEGEEWMYVLSGTVDLYTETYAPLTLGTGDSIYIDSGMGHAMVSTGPEPARVLSVVYSRGPTAFDAALAEPDAPAATARRIRSAHGAAHGE